MRINVKANFHITGIDKDYLEFEGHPTLGEVLKDLEKKSEFPFALTTGKIDPEVGILLNGLEYPFLPKRMDTQLKEGDSVEIMILSMSGG